MSEPVGRTLACCPVGRRGMSFAIKRPSTRPAAAALVMMALAALCIAPCHAQQRPAANRDIYLYQGPDRAERLVSEAKREGTVVLYSTMTLDDANPLIAAFEKKYGIKVSMWRAVNQKLVQRALAEARAGQHGVDVFEGNGPALEILHREDLLEKFYSPA